MASTWTHVLDIIEPFLRCRSATLTAITTWTAYRSHTLAVLSL
jgi:hypothetical protein